MPFIGPDSMRLTIALLLAFSLMLTPAWVEARWHGVVCGVGPSGSLPVGPHYLGVYRPLAALCMGPPQIRPPRAAIATPPSRAASRPAAMPPSCWPPTHLPCYSGKGSRSGDRIQDGTVRPR